MADLPSGTVTFLFTDIEGSTRLWEQHKQAMALALAQHDAILRQAIDVQAGVVYKVIGDAFQAAFTTAPAACAAALAAQRALASAAWGLVGALSVRMALHTCAAEPTDGDYRTGALNRLGRLLGVVHGGQIVLSQSTANLARETLPPDVTLRDLGEHHLRDLRPEPVFQLVAPDLPADFPPLKTLERPRHNLPSQPTALIGREQAIVTICALLRRADVRLVTLTGPGGTGKTRLGLQVASELLDDFTDGVWFVNLAPISDASLVATTVAQALGVREIGGQPIPDRLKDYLRAKRMLILLDNFEQVAAAAPLVGALLASAPALKILVTSRMSLRLSGERELTVAPLGLPDRTQPLALDRLTQYEAVRLFIERAQAVKADFAVTHQNAPAVAEICERLDGLPLAIELAATRVKLFPPQALLPRLANRLKFLTGGARDLPERQQTIRNTIEWSYKLLEAGEQTLFARLGVFVGGCTLEAAEAVCQVDGDLPIAVMDGLAALVDQSLVRQEAGPADEPRFVMLETIREYALERLEERGEAEMMRRQHAAHFLELAKMAESQIPGAQPRVWLNQLEQNHDNLRAALTWSLEQGESETAARLSTALGRFWWMHGHVSEGRRWLAATLAYGNTLPTSLRAKALKVAGELARDQGDYQESSTLLDESLALYRGLGDQRSIADVLINLGHTAWRQGDFQRARVMAEESLARFQNLRDERGITESLNNLGNLAFVQGDYERARALYTESLALRRKQGYTWGIAVSLHNLGWTALEQGDSIRATQLFSESLTLFRELGDKYVRIIDLLEGLARVAALQDRRQRAARLCGVVAILRNTTDVTTSPRYRESYGRLIATLRAQLDEATFAAAWAAGGAMSLEQAIAYALELPA